MGRWFSSIPFLLSKKITTKHWSEYHCYILFNFKYTNITHKNYKYFWACSDQPRESATWIYFLFRRLHASLMALVYRRHRRFVLFHSLAKGTVETQFSPQILGSTWYFPKMPFTFELFISSCVKSSRTRFAHKSFLEQLIFLIWNMLIVLKSELLVSMLVGKSKSRKSFMSFGE